jgi:hypothetical protein
VVSGLTVDDVRERVVFRSAFGLSDSRYRVHFTRGNEQLGVVRWDPHVRAWLASVWRDGELTELLGRYIDRWNAAGAVLTAKDGEQP